MILPSVWPFAVSEISKGHFISGHLAGETHFYESMVENEMAYL